MSNRNKLLAIVGPTASGKTDIALILAKKLNGELISCDSRQVYKGLDIGTGKNPTFEMGQKIKKQKTYWEINGIKIWMYDVVDPKKQYTVADYIKDTGKVIEQIEKQHKLPIIVGGTGFYLKGLLEGIPNLEIPLNKKIRGELENLSVEELQKKLKSASEEKFNSLNQSDKKNPRRLLRSIELVSMYPYIGNSKNTHSLGKNYDLLMIGLAASRKTLNNRIDSRVLSRLGQGMIEEGKLLYEKGVTFKRMRQLGLEYKFIADYLEGKIEMDQFIKLLQTKIHQYAKRQMTWFRKQKNIDWFDITDKMYLEKVEKRVIDWYNS